MIKGSLTIDNCTPPALEPHSQRYSSHQEPSPLADAHHHRSTLSDQARALRPDRARSRTKVISAERR